MGAVAAAQHWNEGRQLDLLLNFIDRMTDRDGPAMARLRAFLDAAAQREPKTPERPFCLADCRID